MVAVLAALVLAPACSGSSSGGAKPSSTTAEGGAAAGGGPTLEGWQRATSAALNTGGASGTLTAMLAPAGAGDGWVVAGTEYDAEGVARAAVWRSPDALLWSVTPVGGPHTEGYAMARRADGGLVVVGREAGGGTSRAAAWLERDGRFVASGGGDALAGGDQVEMDAVAARPDGLVAVGVRSREGEQDAVAVWRSATGETWERVPAAEAVFAASGQAAVDGLVVVPAGVVAVGGVRAGDDLDAAAWFSADGATWAPAGAAPDFHGAGRQVLQDVVALDGGLLAVGAVSDGARFVPAAWRSADGRAWTPAGATFERQGDASDTFGTVVSNVERAPRGLVATGGGAAVQRVWASTDGTTWSEVPVPGVAAGADSFDLGLLAVGGSDVLVGSTFSGVPRVLLLRGGQWTEVTGRDTGFPAPRRNPCCVEVAAAGSRFAATADVTVAGRGLGTERQQVTVVTSPDGLAWTAAPGSPLTRALVSELGVDPDGRLVGVGGLEPPRTSGGQHALATYADRGGWKKDQVVSLPGDDPQEGGTRRFGALATRDHRMVAAGVGFVGTGAGANVDGAVFVQDGGGKLRQVDGVPGLTGPGDQYVDGACAGPKGWLLVGSVQSGAERDAAAWFSPDGEAWEQLASPSFGGPESQAMEDCVATAAGFVAAGSASAGVASTDAAVWTSPDGRSWSRVDAPAVLGGDDEQSIDGLAADGPEVVAVGADRRSGDDQAALWHSGDGGATWDRVDLGAPFRGERYALARSVAVAGTRVVVGGVVDDRVAVWAGPWPLRRGA